MSNFDFNNAEPQSSPFDLIPANTFCKINMAIRPGGGMFTNDGRQAPDEWLTPSKSSDADMLDCEFTVLAGPYAKKKFWSYLVVSGGKQNDQGQSIAGSITRSNLRAILESSRNIDPDDMGDAAMEKRRVTSFGDFHLMEFAVKIGIEKGKDDWPDKNKILSVITPDKKEYKEIMTGTFQNATTSKPAIAPAAPTWQPPKTAPGQTVAAKKLSTPANTPTWAKVTIPEKSAVTVPPGEATPTWVTDHEPEKEGAEA